MAKDTGVTALVKKGVTVVRGGKRVRPEIGKNFDFTAEEADGIRSADAGALGPAADTTTKGEAEVASSTDKTTGKPVASSAEASQANAKDGKKKPTANKSDAEVAAEDDEGEGKPETDDDL